MEVTYDSLVVIGSFAIYETFQAPFVQKVEAQLSGGQFVVIWEGLDATTCGSALTARFGSGAVTNKLKITTQGSGFPQIDAVQICGEVVPFPPSSPPLPPSPPMAPPPCAEEVDIVLVLDNSASVGAQRPDIVAFAHEVVGEFEMGSAEAQFGYVEFSTQVFTRSALTASLSDIRTALSITSTPAQTFLSGAISAGKAVLEGAGARAYFGLWLGEERLLRADSKATVHGEPHA